MLIILKEKKNIDPKLRVYAPDDGQGFEVSMYCPEHASTLKASIIVGTFLIPKRKHIEAL